jgi:outer membrane beta-barrel protein
MTDQRQGHGAMGNSRKIVSRVRRAAVAGIAAGLALLAGAESASAQEILLTGPLAGAPSVRKQKLYREHRFEIAPAASFTLLDEYQRQIFLGARLNYNLTDWFAIGFWGASGAVKINTGLSENIQVVNAQRQKEDAARMAGGLGPARNTLLTAENIGKDFTKQIGTIDWVFAPQLTVVPFRGKIALFQSIYADTDLYLYAGPAFVGVKERKDCKATAGADCTSPSSFALDSRMAIAPTFGLGFSFYVNKWMSFGFDWRGMPFTRNTGGFDNHGGGPNGKFPDYKVDDKDREFKFNQMLTVSWGFYLPSAPQVSE